ncbi:hypothetical protein MASR2M70_08120 [Bacillota bacterium]
MTASFSEILSEILTGSISTVLSVLRVLIPLMIFVEFLHVYHVIDKLSAKLQGINKLLGITPPAILPLLIATVMGVTYGAGTLIEMNERNPLPRKDFILIAVFFFICHGIIETSAIWANAGANIIVVSLVRLAFALLFTGIIARLPVFGKSPSAEEEDNA